MTSVLLPVLSPYPALTMVLCILYLHILSVLRQHPLSCVPHLFTVRVIYGNSCFHFIHCNFPHTKRSMNLSNCSKNNIWRLLQKLLYIWLDNKEKGGRRKGTESHNTVQTFAGHLAPLTKILIIFPKIICFRNGCYIFTIINLSGSLVSV